MRPTSPRGSPRFSDRRPPNLDVEHTGSRPSPASPARERHRPRESRPSRRAIPGVAEHLRSLGFHDQTRPPRPSPRPGRSCSARSTTTAAATVSTATSCRAPSGVGRRPRPRRRASATRSARMRLRDATPSGSGRSWRARPTAPLLDGQDRVDPRCDRARRAGRPADRTAGDDRRARRRASSGRTLGLAARSLGYRIVVLDPDPACPAAAVADEVVVGAYDDMDAALRMAELADVVTYELEHVSAGLVGGSTGTGRSAPVSYALVVTQDRLAERRYCESEGAAVAPWREVRSAADLGRPPRRSVRRCGSRRRPVGTTAAARCASSSAADAEAALDRLGRPDGEPLLLERELAVRVRALGRLHPSPRWADQTFPVAQNRHDAGILVESVAPAPIPGTVARGRRAGRRASPRPRRRRHADGRALPARRWVARGERARTRVHNSGHWTVEACRTSQFEQHIRAICGLPLGSTELHSPVALVNVLGVGPRRPARPEGVDRVLARPARPRPPLRQARGLRAAQDGSRDRDGLDERSGARAGAEQARAAHRLGDERRAGATGRDRRRQSLRLPGAHGRAGAPRAARRPVRAPRRLGPPDAGPPVPLRGDGGRPAGSGSSSPGPAGPPTCRACSRPRRACRSSVCRSRRQHLGGLDSLLSIVQMPRGIPVATVAIGNATNAALLAAAILALGDAALAERLAGYRADQTETVLDDPSNERRCRDARCSARSEGSTRAFPASSA